MRAAFVAGLSIAHAMLATPLIASAQQASSASSATKDATPAIMGALFEPMAQLIANGFDKKEFSETAKRPQIEGYLKALAANANRLEEHATSRERAFEFVARSLGRDARAALSRYQQGYYEEARFLVLNMTDNCIACHASLPEGHKYPGSEHFFSKLKAQDLSPLDRAHFQLVSRQFDTALATFESYFTSREVEPGLVPLLSAFTTYMKVSISVKSDFTRPQPVLRKLIANPSTPVHVRHQLDVWLKTLQQFELSRPLEAISLANAQKLLDEAKTVMFYPRDRDGLIHYLTAETILQRYISARPDRGRNVAQAYFLLGTAATLSESSFWISRSDFYLESAIRLAPSEEFATKAYTMLEESLIGGFTGSSGTHVPEEVLAHLNELQEILRQARSRKT